ncbi:tobamovirus multiplication protein 1-like protein [Tanacetum coccineum]
MVVPAQETTAPPPVPLAHHQIPTGISMAQNQNIPTCRYLIVPFQANDEDEDGGFPREPLLEKVTKANLKVRSRRRCCNIRIFPVGSHQQVMILVTLLIFVIMLTSTVLIWIGLGKNPIDSSVVARTSNDQHPLKNQRNLDSNVHCSSLNILLPEIYNSFEGYDKLGLTEHLKRCSSLVVDQPALNETLAYHDIPEFINGLMD